ncbi:MAG: hypothetical protein QOG95_5385, partial [Mycobacterium sp.]|nr:hypothetical protein [Mycobacterium sp.]
MNSVDQDCGCSEAARSVVRDRYGTAAVPGEPHRLYAQVNVEPMTGIEPAYSAWEADVLPLNYIGAVVMTCGNSDQRAWPRT